jgi:hypothetical protein
MLAVTDSIGRRAGRPAVTPSGRSRHSVAIIGAGLGGLACARRLAEEGVDFVVLEADSVVGGRVRSERLSGFTLDRGFQVLLEAYPEAQRVLDYEALNLRRFYPGALVRTEGAFHLCPDPWRRPGDVFSGLTSPIGSVRDKLRVAALRREVLRGPMESLFEQPEQTTLEYLRGRGFSERMIDSFFRPFYGGVFLDRELEASARMFLFLFRMFASGYTSVPAAGMAAIPAQLAAGIPGRSLRLKTAVQEIRGDTLRLSGGEELRAGQVVVATERTEAGWFNPQVTDAGWREVACLYFAIPDLPFRQAAVVLNGEGTGPVNNLAFMSQVAPEYGDGRSHLLAVTVLAPECGESARLVGRVERQLRDWFGESARKWRHLKTFRIRQALPILPPGTLDRAHRTRAFDDGTIVCGDHRDTASINGALTSGRHAAELAMKRLGVL